MEQITKVAKKAGRVVTDNSPVILTSLGVAGVLGTAYLTATATAKSVVELYNEEYEDVDIDSPIVDKARAVWPNYIPATIVGVSTIGCIVGGHNIHTRRQAALMSLYTLTDATLKEYRAKVAETIGEREETKIREEVDKDRVQRSSTEPVIVTGSGDHLCYDSYSGRYFMSNVEAIRRAENRINSQVINDSYASQNDFYRELGIPTTRYGDEIGWRVEQMMELRFSSHLTEEGKPVLSVDYRAEPIRDYYRNL